MSVEFEEEKMHSDYSNPMKSENLYAEKLTSLGVASNAHQARTMLLVVSICIIVLSFYLFISTNSRQESTIVAPKGTILIEERNAPPRLNKPLY